MPIYWQFHDFHTCCIDYTASFPSWFVNKFYYLEVDSKDLILKDRPKLIRISLSRFVSDVSLFILGAGRSPRITDIPDEIFNKASDSSICFFQVCVHTLLKCFSIYYDNYYDYIVHTKLHATTRMIPRSARCHDNSVTIIMNNSQHDKN